MASIVLSFVGNQDPFGSKTGEGSLVSLVRFLVEQGKEIKKVVLIYTEGASGTSAGAIETKDWLLEELGIDDDAVRLISVSKQLSDDPTDLFEAAQEARRGLDLAQFSVGDGDRIELNASSGTPAMKYSFTLLQAAGYIVNGQVWQVRDPQKMKEGQKRVFETDGSVLRREFDRKVIRKQVENCNYAGALESLRFSSLASANAIALLEYGRCRIAFDFDSAFDQIQLITNQVPQQLLQEIADLRQRRLDAIAKELYFNALIRYRNREFSEFLVLLTQFQECVLGLLIQRKLNLELPSNHQETRHFWDGLKIVDGGQPYQTLLVSYQRRGWTFVAESFPKRPHLIGILEHYADITQVMVLLKDFNEYCEQRNRRVHRFEGVSEIENGLELMAKLKKLIRMLISLPNENPFDLLNQQIYELIG